MTHPRSARPRLARHVLVALVVAVSVVGCSTGGGDDPAPTATVPSGAATGADPAPGAVMSGEPRTVGALADRIATAWPGVRSYRATTTQGTGDPSLIALPGTPAAGAAPPDPDTQAAIDEIVLPAQRHYLEASAGGTSEFIATDGRVYARGQFTQLAVRPDLDPTTWVELDPAFISPDSPIGQFLSGFVGPDAAAFRSPLADLQPDTRARELTPVDPVVVGDRTCPAWRWSDTGETGDAMTRVVSVDPATGLPCSLEFTTGDYVSRVTWDQFNAVVPIAAPAGSVSVGQTMTMTGAATPLPDGRGTDGSAATPIAP